MFSLVGCSKTAFFAPQMHNVPNLTKSLLWKVFSLVCLMAPPAVLLAQKDTSLMLHSEQLKEDDVLPFKKIKSAYTFSSANRADEELLDVPFSTWVISSEEILRYGFVTLADVLKAAPGIRVSQPGNANEGETFMMRGLSGNQYVKILINDVPVKPSMTLGMPIGAQLPIRQAERIEVLYGAGGSLMYGNEACAGVVNIILKETERPIFTQADLGFGSQGFNNLDLMFGGRLFKDKNILKFSLYGSSTVRQNADIFWDNEAYVFSKYTPNGFVITDLVGIERYRRSIGLNDTTGLATLTLTTALPHESRLFGLLLDWKGVKFSYHRMERSDASALGYSPLAHSYAEFGNNIREQTDVINLRLFAKKQKINVVSNLSFLFYNIEKGSTAGLIFDQKNALNYHAKNMSAMSDADRANNLFYYDIYYNSGPRYTSGRSRDIRWENTGRVQLMKHLTADAGVLMAVHFGEPQLGNAFFPERETSQLMPRGPFLNAWIHAYASLNWKYKKWYATAGLANANLPGITPRVAFSYQLDSSLVLFANYSKSYKALPYFQYINTFEADSSEILGSVKSVPPEFQSGSYLKQKEALTSVEFGVKRRFSEILFFAQKAYGLGRDGYLYTNSNNNLMGGYYFMPGLSQQLWGIQLRLVGINTTELRQKGKVSNEVAWKGEVFVQYSKGKEWLGLNYGTVDAIRNYPQWITQLRSSGRSGRFQATFALNRQSSVLSKNAPFNVDWKRNTVRVQHPGFSTIDMMWRFYMNKNFVLYFNVLNVFNRKSYGIDASGSVDDLLAPLQQRRQIRLGINYNMN